MNFIDPITITDTLIGAGASLPEDPTSAWASGTYAVGDERHVVATHRVYRCTVAGSSTVTPQNDPARWQDMRPTNKLAPFDIYTSTAATSTTADIVYPITARFCNALALYGLAGSSYTVVVKDAVGGTVLQTRTGKLNAAARGWADYLFGARRTATKVVLTGLPMRPAAEVTITISATTGATRSLGMVALGKLRSLAGSGQWGGTQYGSSAEPVTYSYINTAEDGTTTITRRHKATNLRFSVAMPREQADNVVALLQSVLDVPVAWFATSNAGYDGLSTFGIAATAPVSYDSHNVATLNGTIKGII